MHSSETELSVLKRIEPKDLWCVAWQPAQTALCIEPLARYIDHNRRAFNRRHRGGRHGGDGALLFIGTKTDCKLFAEIVQETLHRTPRPDAPLVDAGSTGGDQGDS
ncbi:hypothetical protein [Chromobacterium sp. CV08]|uniref:hypothetical protein n=1 Tax=Chromobacterium sp. CV08 TaxID=3133274 RepID=UPI003DA97C1B